MAMVPHARILRIPGEHGLRAVMREGASPRKRIFDIVTIVYYITFS